MIFESFCLWLNINLSFLLSMYVVDIVGSFFMRVRNLLIMLVLLDNMMYFSVVCVNV